MVFNYKTATDKELLEHILASSSPAISAAKAYHTQKNNPDVVERINTCRKILKQRRIAVQLDKLLLETENYGIESKQCSSGVD